MFISGKEHAARPRSHRRLSRKDVYQILHRERARADRWGGGFSVALFEPGGKQPNHRDIRSVARAVLQRARESDDIGWIERDAIYVILHNCSAANAWRFAADACGMAGQASPADLCRVYTYPSRTLADPLQARVSNAAGAREYLDDDRGQPAILHGAGAVRGRTDLRPFFLEGISSELGLANSRTDAVESLLVRPLPWWKRTLDLVVASLALLVLSPVMLAVAAAVKLSSPGPVLFKQWRTGLGGKPFLLYKFRSMVVNADAKKAALRRFSEQDGPAFKMTHDPRVTRLGQFLRRSSLDELPQLWNVLKGEMSLVGPRPLPCEETNACEQWHHRRLDITPGITCIWQVSGRSKVSFAEWVRMDLAYLRQRHLLNDLRIMLQTVPAVLLRRGAR